MDFIEYSIKKPVTVLVCVILLVLFGLIGLQRMPYQLSPEVTEPDITVTTTWRGATPYEIERDIVEEQEKVLKGIPGLIEMESDSLNGMGTVTLRFKIGTDVDDALLRVSNKLNEVKAYPADVDRPVITATGAATSPVIWLILKTEEGNTNDADSYLTFFENEVRQHLERVEGVADLFIGGGRKEELHVVARPERLAAYGLTVNDVMNALRTENENVSAGTMGVGRRDFRIRTTGEFKSPRDVENVVISSTGQRRVFLKDVADVSPGFAKKTAIVMHNAKGGMAVGIKPEPDANILEMTDKVEDVVKWVNEEKMRPKGIYLDWVYDQRPYINEAIYLIKQDILIGGILAAAILFLFLRSMSSTVVAISVLPISIIGTFIVMALTGRTLNVVSLAGIAFAVSMLIDNAIVVLENIDRHRKMGKSAFEASYHGAREVWGAILASSLTNIVVFLPVIFMREEVGQLFRDIAIAATCAVMISLFVSVSVIPVFTRKLFGVSDMKAAFDELPTGKDLFSRAEKKAIDIIMAGVSLATRDWKTRVTTIAGLTAFSIIATLALLPKMEYLPQGNRNLVINLMVPPPGLSYEERKDIGETLFKDIEPYMGKDHGGYPGIRNMFYIGAEQIMLFGAMSTHEQRAGELVPLFTDMIRSFPAMFGVSSQAGVFQTRLGRGRTVSVDVSGADIDNIVMGAGMLYGKIQAALPDSQIRPVPSLELTYPEVKIIPDRDRLKANGMSAADLGVAVDVLMDGRDVGDYKEEGKKKIDLLLMAPEENIKNPEALYGSLVATPGGKVVPVSSLAGIERTAGIPQIRHLERNRTITLEVTPPLSIPLEEATDRINGVVGALRSEGGLKGLDVGLGGAADKLKEAQKALVWNLILAALICYLLMAALYENFIYPLLIMLTVPLAGVGGFIGLKLMNIFIAQQPFDILTALGFVILIGIVVNNAILIVHQSLNNIRSFGMDYKEAVLESTRTRLRPIYMAALTSIFGLVPLVLFPGAGAEFYRGIGSVLLGGLAIGTFFTVFMIPALLMFFIKMEKKETSE